ncbi:MAG TPA: alpha/beta hydrolase [Solirubrobacteraceae bacterium]|nr:alpha/beta hydrolase [Solirubrobacteraceae bacterium]
MSAAPADRLAVASGAARLAGERRGRGRPLVVLLHAGVADRRSWRAVMDALPLDARLVAYDRRGFGETTVAAAEPHDHAADLGAVLDAVADGPAWLVGSSQGGRIAIDFTLARPERVAGLVLVAPAVSGWELPDVAELDEPERRLARLVEEAEEAGDLDAVNRYEAWFWLDGPRAPEGRVTGAARDLVLEMNGRALAAGDVGPAAEPPPARERLGEIAVPALVAWGDLDLVPTQRVAAGVAERVPGARQWVIAGTAHLPYLERPRAFAEHVARFVASERPGRDLHA